MTENQKDFLIVEYQEVAGNLRTFWNKRMTIMGLGITLMGILITQSAAASTPTKYLYDLCLILLLFTIIKIFGSLSKPMYLFTFRMNEISEQYEVSDFWAVWQRYVVKNPMDSGTATFYIISIFFNWFVSLYVIVLNLIITFKEFEKVGMLNLWLCIIIIMVALIFFFVNFYTIKHELNPKNFHPELIQQWDEASRSVKPNK